MLVTAKRSGITETRSQHCSYPYKCTVQFLQPDTLWKEELSFLLVNSCCCLFSEALRPAGGHVSSDGRAESVQTEIYQKHLDSLLYSHVQTFMFPCSVKYRSVYKICTCVMFSR